jgi:peptidoglycan/LPS O-acetylase OafA/YrhL
MKTYFSLLDALRFFAAFWVMNFHYLFIIGISSDIHWYRYGNLGVQLFFIISGFVIIESIQGKSLREFAKGRFLRLFPLFWVICTFTYIITLVVPHTLSLHFYEYLVSMTMFADTINGFMRNTFSLIDPSYWTLTVELIFYITIGVVVYLFSYKRIRYFFLFWLILSMGAFILHIDQNFYTKLLLVRHASYFIFGGALSLIATKQAENLLEKYLDWFLLISSAVYSVYIHPLAIPAYTAPNTHDQIIISWILVGFFIIIKFLFILGGLTYPLYLLHQRIGNAVINYMTSRFDIKWDAFAVCFEVFIILVAYLVYLQDKKLRSWLKNKI